jgi:hypothetical protein
MDNKLAEKKELGLYAPWVVCYRKIEALFKYDTDIKMIFNNKEKTLKMFVKGQDKYEALTQILPVEKDGLKIQIIPENNLKLSTLDLYRRAFSGNPVVTDIISIPREIIGSTNNFDYVVFKKEVVQYNDDSLNDPHGNCSTLYQFLADDIFVEHGGIYFCTDRDET